MSNPVFSLGGNVGFGDEADFKDDRGLFVAHWTLSARTPALCRSTHKRPRHKLVSISLFFSYALALIMEPYSFGASLRPVYSKDLVAPGIKQVLKPIRVYGAQKLKKRLPRPPPPRSNPTARLARWPPRPSE